MKLTEQAVADLSDHQCVNGIVNHVSDLAIANPPEPLP